MKYYSIHDVLKMKLLHIEKIHTNENGLDMITKSLPMQKLNGGAPHIVKTRRSVR